MGIGFNSNDYGITRKEFREFQREMKKLDKENDQIELSRKDYKEIKEHVKNGDLGAYMETVGEEMRAAMGLSLKNKVDVEKEIEASLKILHEVNLGQTPDGKAVDVAKVSEFIRLADVPRIAKKQEEFKEIHKNLEFDNSRAMSERFFADSSLMEVLNGLQGQV